QRDVLERIAAGFADDLDDELARRRGTAGSTTGSFSVPPPQTPHSPSSRATTPPASTPPATTPPASTPPATTPPASTPSDSRGTTMTDSDTVWLTAGAFDRLRHELAELRRQGDCGSGAEAFDGDDRALHTSRVRSRVRELEALLHRAVVGEAPPDDGVAEPGMVLTVRFDDDEATETFLLGVRDGAGGDGLETYSPDSPLGRALTGAVQGEERTYTVPSGRTVRVRLVRAVPYAGR